MDFLVFFKESLIAFTLQLTGTPLTGKLAITDGLAILEQQGKILLVIPDK